MQAMHLYHVHAIFAPLCVNLVLKRSLNLNDRTVQVALIEGKH
jgi:hypothetical protein